MMGGLVVLEERRMMRRCGRIGSVGVILVVVGVGGSGFGVGRADGLGADGAVQGGAETGKMEAFVEAMNVGKGYLDKGDAKKAIATFEKAVAIHPVEAGARLNLANAMLLDGRVEDAVREARAVLGLDRNSAAAHYVIGCARSRMGEHEAAARALQESLRIEPGVAAANYQLGKACRGLGWRDEALSALRDCLRLEPNHLSAHYVLGQLLARGGDREAAMEELKIHAELLQRNSDVARTEATFERCKHTRAVVPEAVDQPARRGINVRFVDATARAFGDASADYAGPVGAMDVGGDGVVDLVVADRQGGFRWLLSEGGVFRGGARAAGVVGAKYRRIFAGDLDNDGFEDCVIVGDRVTHVFRGGEGGVFTDVAEKAGVSKLGGRDAVLVDLDHTGKLDLIGVDARDGRPRVLRNRGEIVFDDVTEECGMPKGLAGVARVAAIDFNGDGATDLIVSREGEAAALIENVLLGMVTLGDTGPTPWPTGGGLAVGDLNNDLRPDFVVASKRGIEVVYGPDAGRVGIRDSGFEIQHVELVDYDNDGWLDVFAVGAGVRVWRNVGLEGFEEVTGALGLGERHEGTKARRHEGMEGVETLTAGDLDADGDTDLVLSMVGGGLRYLRNDGGDANRQLKLRLTGTRSNRSGVGVLIELRAGGFRTARTVSRFPVEIGVGRRERVDTLTVVWSDQIVQAEVFVEVTAKQPLLLKEPRVTSASCPYLYAWDGAGFRFVTDILGASPVGLPMSDRELIASDVDEYVRIGDASMFPRREGRYEVAVTEELREVLYLDQARVVAVDHPFGTEVHSTDKLRPAPFEASELVALGGQRRLLGATVTSGEGTEGRRDEGTKEKDVTGSLSEIDGVYCSPPKVRRAQLRGLAEAHAVTFDFGPVEADERLVLALTGWLLYGGGTANVAASHDPELPDPFPVLWYETTGGTWTRVDVVVGAPAGRTKTILVELTGALRPGTGRFRLTSGLEIHWDRIAMFERWGDERVTIRALKPVGAELGWHGFGVVGGRAPCEPEQPSYADVSPIPKWRFTPSGWCTRYGDVGELVGSRDGALAILNGGDGLLLSFDAADVPALGDGLVRDFFFHSVGWEKDADYHVRFGRTVEPLPFHGMDDQAYGLDRSAARRAGWIEMYNRRWVGPGAGAMGRGVDVGGSEPTSQGDIR